MEFDSLSGPCRYQPGEHLSGPFKWDNAGDLEGSERGTGKISSVSSRENTMADYETMSSENVKNLWILLTIFSFRVNMPSETG